MTRQLLTVVLAVGIPCLAVAQTTTAPPTQSATAPRANVAAVPYGSNRVAGKTFVHDGVTLYYEVYGRGTPLLVVHGNSGSIGTMAAQIAFFRSRYRVIAMDSRDHGRSGDSPGPITYEKMTDDLAALLDHLNTGPVDVLGWSDGGIEALLLGIRHPAKVKKIAAMAASLSPSTDAIYPETLAMAESTVSATSAATKDTPQGRRAFKVSSMLLEEPNIAGSALQEITAPTLVLAGDHDLIRDEHTLDIFHHVPNSQLAIVPNATHMLPFDDPVLFNATVERFLRVPFVKKDRIKDFLLSAESLMVSLRKK